LRKQSRVTGQNDSADASGDRSGEQVENTESVQDALRWLDEPPSPQDQLTVNRSNGATFDAADTVSLERPELLDILSDTPVSTDIGQGPTEVARSTQRGQVKTMEDAIPTESAWTTFQVA
jgi:hypothetical protein